MKREDQIKKIQQIQDLLDLKREIDKLLDDLYKVIGRNPEGSLQDLIYKLFNSLVDKTSKEIGDKWEWLDWFIWVNDMGENAFEAGYGEDTKPIRTIEDLIGFLEDNNDCPYCHSNGTWELRYLGGHPHLYQYSCTECGVSSPIASKDTPEDSKVEAKRLLDDFLDHWR